MRVLRAAQVLHQTGRRSERCLKAQRAALEAWREKGTMPAEITAFNPESGLSRPLCAYPQYAKYNGTGNMKDAANWKCVAP